MKQGWKIKKLGEVLSLEYGKPLPKEKRIHKGLYPVYGANGIINRTNEYYVDETSIIVGRKGSAGEINYTEEKFWPLDVTYYTKFDKNELNLNFLYYLLSLLELPKLAKGVKPGINRNDIYAIKTFIPFLSEQKRIVSKLDQCFEAIDKARANVERNRQNAKELFQSRKNDLFKKLEEDVSKVPLPSVCDEIFAGGDAPKGNYSKEKAEKFNIPIFANAVKDNGLYGYTNLNRVSKPSITIAARGSGTGHTEIRYEPFFPIVRLIVITPKIETVNLEFLKYSIQNFDIMRSGSAIPQLTVPMIKGYSLPLPTLMNQKQIVNKLDDLKSQTQSLESNYLQELDALDELKKSILQKAFNGEL